MKQWTNLKQFHILLDQFIWTIFVTTLDQFNGELDQLNITLDQFYTTLDHLIWTIFVTTLDQFKKLKVNFEIYIADRKATTCI